MADKRQPTNLSLFHDPSMVGRDEMNLAEFPFATLRRANEGPDGRDKLEYSAWITDPKTGIRGEQKWIVSGGAQYGLPSEFDERVYVALMAVTAQTWFQQRRVEFSINQLIKIMGLSKSSRTYDSIELALKRLVGVTIYAEGSFWDNEAGERIEALTGFHILERFWLRCREPNPKRRETESGPGYIVWSEEIWSSFQANFIKDLDLQFFYSLDKPLSRRIYRFIDKKTRYDPDYQLDIFDFAGRLGMGNYDYPSHIKAKLKDALDELIDRGYLESYDYRKHGKYTRIHVRRAAEGALTGASSQDQLEMQEDPYEALRAIGVSPGKARRLVEAHGADTILEKLAFLKWKLSTPQPGRPISDRAGWVIRAIERDFEPPAAFYRYQEARLADQFPEPADDGAYSPPTPASRGPLQDLQSECGTSDAEKAAWVEIRSVLEYVLNPETYREYLRNAEVLRLSEEELLLVAPSTAKAEFIVQRLAQKILATVADVTGHSPSSIDCRSPEVTTDRS